MTGRHYGGAPAPRGECGWRDALLEPEAAAAHWAALTADFPPARPDRVFLSAPLEDVLPVSESEADDAERRYEARVEAVYR
jgi:hypothetical protein